MDVEKQIPEGAVGKPYSVAVVIGNQRYARQGRGIGDVRYAEKDASVMKKYLTRTLGYHERNIIARNNLTSGDFRNIFGSKETRRGVLHNYIHPNTKEVFIYYSGHGAPSHDGKKSYLVPVDAQADLIANNGYNLDLLYEMVENLDAPKATVVLDACFSGDSMAGTLFKNISPAMVKTSDFVKRVANAAIFCGADKNGDRTITVGEMQNYLNVEVPYWAMRESNRRQTPRVTGKPDSVLAKLK